MTRSCLIGLRPRCERLKASIALRGRMDPWEELNKAKPIPEIESSAVHQAPCGLDRIIILERLKHLGLKIVPSGLRKLIR